MRSSFALKVTTYTVVLVTSRPLGPVQALTFFTSTFAVGFLPGLITQMASVPVVSNFGFNPESET